MSIQKTKTNSVARLTYLALLTGIVFLLQAFGNIVAPGNVSFATVLLPIVIGAVLLGPAAGAWLGGAFGLAVLLLNGATFFLEINPLATIVIVLLKGTLCGLVPGLLFRLLKGIKPIFAIMIAAASCPIVNTGIFLIGSLLFYMDAVGTQATGSGFSPFGYLILVWIGLNFLCEFFFNVLLSPVIVRVVSVFASRFETKK